MKYLDETLAVAQRILIELVRRRRSLVFWMIFPISILIINGYIMSEKGNMSLDRGMEFAAPSTIVGSALFFSCLGGTLATIVTEREQGTLKRLFISPLSGLSYFLGIFLAHSCIGLTQTLVVYLVTTAYGAQVEGSIWLGLAIILLSILAYVGGGFLLGAQFAKRTEDINAILGTFGIPLLILGGAFLPTALFPKQLLEIAKYNPIYHMNEALIEVWAKGETFQEMQEHLIFIVLFCIVMMGGGWLSYRRMLRVEKRL